MHQLILLRHAKAAPEQGGGADHDRPLTPAGRQAARAVGLAMRKAGLEPDVVLVSSALRTQQTLSELQDAGVWDEWPNIDTLAALYMATPGLIREQLRGLGESVRSAIVIGHNPGLHQLALELADGNGKLPPGAKIGQGYPTASLAEFLVTTAWRRLDGMAASLQRFWRPADL